MTTNPGLVPELAVTDYEASKRFWCDLVGFSLRYERPEEGIWIPRYGSAHVMLDQIDQGRTWATGPLEFPPWSGYQLRGSGRQSEWHVAAHHRGRMADLREPEEKWYRAGEC